MSPDNRWWPATPLDIAGRIDHTILRPSATRSEVVQVAREGLELNVAAVCVHPSWVSDIADVLKGSEVKVCAVVGFPTGMHRPQSVAFESDRAIREGAQEIDMVIPIGRVKTGEWDLVQGAVATAKAAIGKAALKVIIEVCELTTDEIRIASEKCYEGGADFVKTSTGFAPGGATVESVRIISRVARSYGGKVKAAGGIRDLATLRMMVEAGADRIGTSATVAILQEAREYRV